METFTVQIDLNEIPILKDIFTKLDRIESLISGNKTIAKTDYKRNLSFDEALAYTGFSRSYLYKLTSSRQIPYSKPNGKLVRFDMIELDEWLKKNRVKTKEEIEREALTYISKKSKRY